MRTLSSQASRRLTLAELYSTIICLPLSVTRSDILSPKLSYFISSPMQLGHGKMGHVWYGWSTVKVRWHCERCGPVEGGRLNQDGKDWHNWQVMFSLNKIVSNILMSNFGWLQALFVTHSQVTVIAVQYLTEVLLWRVEITTCIQTDNSWGIQYARPGTPRWCDQWSSQYGCCWWPGAYLAPGHLQQSWRLKIRQPNIRKEVSTATKNASSSSAQLWNCIMMSSSSPSSGPSSSSESA